MSGLPARLFVTGTDTGIGKTVVTAALAASAEEAVGLKPLASGVPAGAIGDDAALLALGSGGPAESYRSWVMPVSPHRAAIESGVGATLEGTLAWVRARERARTYVEGVGGWRVPVMLDWGIPELAGALGWPVLVVAGNRLGVLNHTLLTVDAVRAAGLAVAGVVLNDGVGATSPDDNGPAQRRNLADLRLLLGCPVVAFPAVAALTRGGLAAAGTDLRERWRSQVEI